MKDVAVIIVTYNSRRFVRDCILSVLDRTKGVSFEIIIVDNNSTDNSIEELEKEFHEVTFIKNKANLGFGAANNVGICRSSSKYIFLLNPDTIIQNDAVSLFYRFMEGKKNFDVWCCGANIIDENYKSSKSYGYFASVEKILFEQFGFNRIFKKFFNKKFKTDHNDYNNLPKEVPFIIGADMFIRREQLDRIGLFDEEFDLNFEEAELSFRAMKLGYNSVLLPEAKIIHYGGHSFKSSEQQWFYYRKNEILFTKKCFPFVKYSLTYIIYIMGTLFRAVISFNEYDFLLLKYMLGKDKKLR